MATALSARSTTQHQQPSTSSPSISSKRPPPGFKQPTNPGIGSNNTAASVVRLNNRRRDPHKLNEDALRQSKGLKLNTADNSTGDKKAKRIKEPYVKTTGHILKKYSRSPPSFILHLHPTHFRFDEQDGSFSYSSPMRVLLEHIRAQTVPHEMLEELVAAGIKFYDNCLIVQIQDHRNSSPATQTTSSSAGKELNQPYSIHNYNQHITPSPLVAYPDLRTSDGKEVSGKDSADAVSHNTSADREEAAGGNGTAREGPKIFTTVLFPTAVSLQEELAGFASTIDNRSNTKKQNQANSKTPASATVPFTPSAGSFPGTLSSGQANKKQRLLYTAKDVVEFESKVVSATAPPLFLEPVDSLEEAQALLEKMQDPLLSLEPPAPKSRKRTVAELAADEALAAEEQRFMLIMDERLVPTSAASNASKNAGAVAESGTGTFEARFERFKAIDEIRSLQQERKQQEQEARVAQQQQQQRLKLEQQEREAAAAASRQQLAQEQKAREGLNAQRRQEQAQTLQARQLQNQAQQNLQPQLQQVANQHGHPQTSASMMHSSQQIAASQAHHSSPIVRHMTPHNASSPHVTNGHNGHGNQGIPMSASTSNQGAGSPARPGSAMQHHHQAVSMTAQRSQQPPSRNGTPAMPNGTPRISQSTPVMRNVTPTPRINHASPVLNQGTGPQSINQFVVGTPHINGQQHLTPQQQHIIFQQRQALHNQQMQGSPNGQMPTQNLQQLAAQQFAAAQQAQRAGTEASYRQSLQNLTQQQMSNAQINHQAYPNGMSMHHMQMQQSLPHQGGNMQQGNQWQQMYQSALTQFLHRFRDQAIAAYGPQLPPLVLQQVRSQAEARARSLVQQKRQQESRQMMLQPGNGNMGGMGGM